MTTDASDILNGEIVNISNKLQNWIAEKFRNVSELLQSEDNYSSEKGKSTLPINRRRSEADRLSKLINTFVGIKANSMEEKKCYSNYDFTETHHQAKGDQHEHSSQKVGDDRANDVRKQEVFEYSYFTPDYSSVQTVQRSKSFENEKTISALKECNWHILRQEKGHRCRNTYPHINISSGLGTKMQLESDSKLDIREVFLDTPSNKHGTEPNDLPDVGEMKIGLQHFTKACQLRCGLFTLEDIPIADREIVVQVSLLDERNKTLQKSMSKTVDITSKKATINEDIYFDTKRVQFDKCQLKFKLCKLSRRTRRAIPVGKAIIQLNCQDVFFEKTTHLTLCKEKV